MTPRQTIVIPIAGWDITYDGDELAGEYVAVRQTPLTQYQTMHGAEERIIADDHGELFILCDAQTRLAERLQTAHEVGVAARRRREEETAKRVTELRSRPGVPGGDVGSGPGPRLA